MYVEVYQILYMLKHVEDVKDYFDLQHLQHASTYIALQPLSVKVEAYFSI